MVLISDERAQKVRHIQAHEPRSEGGDALTQALHVAVFFDDLLH